MHYQHKITAFVQLSAFFKNFREKLENNNNVGNVEEILTNQEQEFLQKINQSYLQNNWFTKDNVLKSLKAWENSLTEEKLNRWLEKYDLNVQNTPKTVGIIMAGNIPLVGFHDLLCVLLTGNIAKIKLSSSDNLLIPFISELLTSYHTDFKNQIVFSGTKLEGFDAVIATGSNNTARYFEYYFGKYPHIIRKNRNSVAILHGDENDDDINNLGHDIFDYFGLGCRSVSKLYLPKGFEIHHFYKNIFDYKEVVNHNKYANNYDYNKAIYLLDGVDILDNNFLLIKEDNEAIASPVGVLFYEYYENIDDLKTKILHQLDHIQCIVSKKTFLGIQNEVKLGKTQEPELWDYADNIDTIEFLIHLKI
jgi:hypothetical protein